MAGPEFVDAGEFEAMHGLGHLHHAIGDATQVLAHHQAALGIAHELAQHRDEARAHDGIADAHAALGNLDLARHRWEQALAIFTDLEAPEADRLRAALGAGSKSPPHERPASL
jgi:tetratricopeptide (TPR) repeat protein